MSNDIFLRASRARLRFQSANGNLTVEDLWEIPLTTSSSNKASIENIGAGLLEKQSKYKQNSILGPATRSAEQETVDLAVEVLRTVAQIRQAEINAKTLAAAKASEAAKLKQRIEELEFSSATPDELRARLAALQAS